MFKIIEPSIVRAQFASKRDASFSSYLQPGHLRNQKQQRRTEDCDQISIFDAAEYFKGVHDDEQKEQATLPGVLDPSLMGRISSVSSIDNGNYRARSFHATPAASSEASWSSRTGLLQANPSGSMGVGMIKIPSPSTSTTTNTTTTKWGRISSKWLIPGRKCPCSGKKSVQVEERIEAKTPRMVDLGRCSSSNGTNYPSSLYSTRQSSPKISPSNGNSGLNLIPKKFDYTSTSTTTIAAKNRVGYSCPKNSSNNTPNGFLPFSSNPKVVSTIAATTTAVSATTVASSTTTVAPTTNGFTFPVLENPPVGVKKMFNVIAPDHHPEDPHRDSLEVFQPRSCPRSRRTSYEEDTALSDGSSDLFEIESFTTSYYNPSINNNTVKRFASSSARRHSVDEETNGGDEMESVAPTECYAPSEVSIDWSVTTAEGFDRSSLANFPLFASEVRFPAMRREAANSRDDNGTGNDKRNNKGTGNNAGGLLMSCRCEKAVSVGPGPIKCPGLGEGLGRHVSGKAKEEGQTAAHVMIGAAAAGNDPGGVGVVMGRSRPNLLPMPFAA